MPVAFLTPEPFRLVSVIGLTARPFIDKVQALIDARTSDTFAARSAVPLIEAMIPACEPPPGLFGEIVAEVGELRTGPGAEVALIMKGVTAIGTRGEVLGDMRDKLIAVYERKVAEGVDRYEAARQLAMLKAARPVLAVVR